jgi:hypothetical protein
MQSHLTRRAFVASTAAGVLLPNAVHAQDAVQTRHELTGKTICGYQGWFNAKGDGMDLGWRHYSGRGGRFEPGRCTIDLWPDVSELSRDERYDTDFRHEDGSVAQVYSSASEQAIAMHFDWMQAYGIDGVAVQRFGTNLRKAKLKKHHDTVIMHAQQVAKRTGRLWMAMYDLSGMKKGEPQQDIAKDWREMVKERDIIKDPSYLHHEGRPIVALWGVGFSGDRHYTLKDCAELIKRVAMDGRFRVMLGTPYYWREQRRDAIDDPALHDVLKQADIISPWAVGRYDNPETALRLGQTHVADDLAWCSKHRKHYLPVIFPGFSWHNLKKNKGEAGKLNQIPRLGGEFLWAQAEAVRAAGAQSLYVAMFDEVDEGTAIFKCTNNPPIGESKFLTYEGLPSDHYLWLTGQIGKRLREGKGPAIESMPKRK